MKITNSLFHKRLLIPSFFYRFLISRRMSLFGSKCFVSNNFKISRIPGLIYININFISNSLGDEIELLTKGNTFSVFWSYKGSIIFLVEDTSTVYRVCGPDGFKFNLLNYKNLQLINKYDVGITPDPLDYISLNDASIFSETLLTESQNIQSLKYQDVFDGLYNLYKISYVKKSFTQITNELTEKYINLVPLENKNKFDNLCKRKIDEIKIIAKDIDVVCCQIHGDLTFRNIVFGKKGLSYLDLDRSESSFAEFDLFMLWIDVKMTSSGNVSYQISLDLIADLDTNADIRNSLQKFYEEMPEFSLNLPYLNTLISLYYVRSVAYIMSDAGFDRNIPIESLK